jgi:hypothetical protein
MRKLLRFLRGHFEDGQRWAGLHRVAARTRPISNARLAPTWHPIIRNSVPRGGTGRDGLRENPRQFNVAWDRLGRPGTPAALYKTAALPLRGH